MFLKAFKAVVFEEDELESRDMSVLEAFLLNLANQGSNFDAENKFYNIWKRRVRLKLKVNRQAKDALSKVRWQKKCL